MKQPIGFILTGEISNITRETNCRYDSPDKQFEDVTDLALQAEVCEQAHVSSGDDFAEYSDLPVTAGYMSFAIEMMKPVVKVKYFFNMDHLEEIIQEDDIIVQDGANRSLDAFVSDVIDETRGQLSDGIGEGFEQYPCYETDEWIYFISPGYPDMTVQYIYE